MRQNPVKRALAAGDAAIGTIVFEFGSSGIGRIAAGAGADFVMFDLEHTGWSIETLRTLVATTRAADVVPMARVPATEYHLISRPFDVGVMGLMMPMVETADQGRRIVQSAKYPPIGRRGAAFGLVHDDYVVNDVGRTMESANREGLLIAQIETATGLDNVDEIAAVDGIDVLWIGHFDLSNSLGIPAQFDHPDYLRAVDRVLRACHRHGKAPGFMVSSAEEGRAKLAQGFTCLAYSGDLWIYADALRRGIAAIRGNGR